MEEKRTLPLPADPAGAGRKRTVVIAGGAVLAVAVAVVSVVAVFGGSSPSHKPGVGVAAATGGSSPYATDAGGGYSQPPSFTWSARSGQPSAPTPTSPSSSSGSAPVTSPPPTGPASGPSQPTSVPAPPKSPHQPPASSPTSAAPPAPTSSAATSYQISGTVSCLSGHSVEGVWVQAAQGSGYSPWQGIGNGSTSRYWYTLPSTMAFSLHVGCGGTQDSWAVALTAPDTQGPVANFTCHDISGQADYGKCELQ